MAVATTHSISLDGALGHLIEVQADVSSGIVGTILVGRGDIALSEARDRVRMAVINSGFEWPNTRRTTVLLSPADLPKRGTHFDLAIAVAVLLATGVVVERRLDSVAFIGELTLGGGLRSVPGVLPMVLAAAERGITHVFVPEPQTHEAELVPGVTVVGMRSLGQVVAELQGEEPPAAPPVAPMSGIRLLSWRGDRRLEEVDLSDLFDLADAKYAAEVAAGGGHALLLTGAKGAGKTSLAERIPTILPDLTAEEALELTAIHSLAGALEPGDGLVTRPPFSAPHHDASKASIIGGGSGHVRPGELSRCHAGVLFLDEFPLFRRDIIEALRQPLESGDVTVARQEESVTLPARGLLVLASNPCPCGEWSASPKDNRCKCRSQQLRDYQSKLSGPIVDRIDITRNVAGRDRPVRAGRLPRQEETSAAVRARVAAARARQQARYAGCDWRLNSEVPGAVLRERWPLAPAEAARLEQQVYEGRLSSRGAVRVHRLAWTVADLAAVHEGLGKDDERPPTAADLDTALRLRTGSPLLSRVLERRAG